MTKAPDVLRALWSAVQPPGADHLLARVRWLFLVLLALVVSTTVLGTVASPFPVPSRPGAVLAVLVWWGWAVYRYRRPGAHAATDAVPLLAMATLGLASGTTFLLFGPAFVSLYYRTMFGSRRQAIAFALGYFVVYELVWFLTPMSGPVEPVGSWIMLVTFAGVAAVMHALATAARGHDRLVARERILADLSGAFLTTTSPDAVLRLAVDGALALTAGGVRTTPSATLWLGRDDFRRVASAGPDHVHHQRVTRQSLPATVAAQLEAGAPFLLDGPAVIELQEALGQLDTVRQLLAVPIVRGSELAGAVVIAATDDLPSGLIPLMGRFANEIAMALDRAELLEDLRQANLRLREANAAKDEFVSTVSHELRTPLTSIRGFAQTLRLHWTELDAGEREQYLEIIERQSRNQQRLVEDLLTTARVMSEGLPVAPTVVDVRDAIRDAVDVLVLDADVVMVDAPRRLQVVVDPQHLHQTFTNLLTNAQKYGAAPYEIRAGRDGDEAVITVCDHGTGVPPEFRDRLFEPFAQADTGDRRTSRGVGLGLSIVQRLLAANGGAITCLEAGPTPGAGFEVRLPLAGPPVSSAPVAACGSQSGHP